MSPAASLRSLEQKLSCFWAETMGFLERGAGCPLWVNDRDRGEPRGSAPPTPPYVRVRIRRFEKNANALRSNDSTRVGWAFGFMHRRERFDVMIFYMFGSAILAAAL